MKYCAKCGFQNEDDIIFCNNCGNDFRLNNDDNQPQQQPQMQQQPQQQQQFYQQPPSQQQQFYQPPPPPVQPAYYQQPYYQPYPPPVQPMPIPGKGMAIASLVLGICSIPLYIIFPIGIVGIILAILGKKKMMSVGAPTGMATAGLVLSIIGTVFGAILFVTCIAAAGAASCAASPTYWY